MAVNPMLGLTYDYNAKRGTALIAPGTYPDAQGIGAITAAFLAIDADVQHVVLHHTDAERESVVLHRDGDDWVLAPATPQAAFFLEHLERGAA